VYSLVMSRAGQAGREQRERERERADPDRRSGPVNDRCGPASVKIPGHASRLSQGKGQALYDCSTYSILL
jgi:hypothetical protein